MNRCGDQPRCRGASQVLHLNSGGAWPGATMTELNSPQRPHCRASFVGSFTIGLVAAVTAKLPCARSSALLSAGPRRRTFIAQPSSGACDARSRSCARADFPCSDLPLSNPLCAPAWRSLPHQRPWRQCPAKKCAAKRAWNMIPKSCRLFRQDHTTKQKFSTMIRFNRNGSWSRGRHDCLPRRKT